MKIKPYLPKQKFSRLKVGDRIPGCIYTSITYKIQKIDTGLQLVLVNNWWCDIGMFDVINDIRNDN